MAARLTALTLFSLRQGTSETQWNAAVHELIRMWESIPEVRAWSIGPNGLTEERSGGFSHVIMLEFESEDDW